MAWEETTRSEAEINQFLAEDSIRRQELFQRGKIIVIVITVANLFVALLGFLVDSELLSLLIQIALSAALLSGFSWVRYLFAVGAALSALGDLFVLLGGVDFSANPMMGVLFALLLVIDMAFCIVSSVLLFRSKAVTEYLYTKRNG
ncbi:MAG: hypothetical protein E7486_02285 [Ruminococcaceae bacterium]|nr:hypothetical protein [Oscillospiraceae bacterium]